MIVIKIWGLHNRQSQLESMVERYLDKQTIEYEAEDVKEWAGDVKYYDVHFKIDSTDDDLLKKIEKKFARSDESIWMEAEWNERMG